MMNNSDVPPWPSRVPPGVPGAGWLIGILFVGFVLIFSDWAWEGSHTARANPAAAHHTGGVGH
jgi:hypothetical protein